MAEEFDGINVGNVEKDGDKDCPQCGATLIYEPESHGLYCQYCDYREEIERKTEGKVMEKPLDFDNIKEKASFEWGKDKKLIVCESCGAEAVYDVLEASNVCPFCGANHVMELDMKDAMPPDGVVPFKIGQKEAAEKFKAWMGSKFFAPEKAKKQAEPESFFGIYLPYWSFDSDTLTYYSGSYGINRTVYDKDGKTRIVTDWYSCSGNYSSFIDDELVIATTKHDKKILKSVEPFDTNNCMPYKPEYLSGFVAERYSTGLEDGWDIGKMQIKRELEGQIGNYIMNRHRADTYRIRQMDISYLNTCYKLVVLPLWQSSFKYGGKEYHFMVNGESGRVGGQSPVSALKVIIVIAIIFIIVYCIYRFM